MKFDIGAVFGQLVELYAKLPMAQKIALPVLIAGSMGVMVFISRWAGEPDYITLFSGLAESDAASVIEKLKDDKIGYQLRDGGATVAITPPEMVHELRLQLAAVGLPSSGRVGFELFDESKLGLTAFQEKINFIRGTQGELERTIMAISAVKAVRVHITTPKRSVFVRRDVLPTASVLLHLKAGSELSKAQIKGISNLVSGSVERLKPENVTIVDSKGNLLNDTRENEDLNEADLTRIDYQRKIEGNYERRVESMLAEVLGHGRVVTRVTAELDFSRYEKEEEAYDPAGQVTRSERSVSESSGLTAEGGVPGVISNLTDDPGVLTPPDSSENNNVRSESVKNYEVSRAVSRTKSAIGKVLRLSVAVLVDGQRTVVPVAEGADPLASEYAPLSAAMLKKIDTLVKQSIGYDSTRGDTVSVENIEFIEPDPSVLKALESDASNARYVSWAQMIGPFIVAALFLLIMGRVVARLLSPSQAEVDLSRLLPAGIEELEAELEAERGKLATIDDQTGVNIHELEEILAENSRLVKENPQQAALLIRYWLNEGRV